jgi:hypothetical protein
LLDIVNKEQTKDLICPLNQIKIIAFKDKNQWNLVTKYTIGNKY